MSVRRSLAKAWLGALGRGGAGAKGGSVSPPSSVLVGSTPKSRAPAASGFSKVINSSFSESARLGF